MKEFIDYSNTKEGKAVILEHMKDQSVNPNNKLANVKWAMKKRYNL